MKHEVVLISKRSAVGRQKWATDPRVKISYDLYIDLDKLDSRALTVSRNKNRSGRIGPLRFKVRSVEPAQ